MNSEVLLESCSLRIELCTEENASILEEIGQLRTLPKTGWATTEQMAEFYGVLVKTIEKIIERHKDEFIKCGYKILYKKDLARRHYVGELTYFKSDNYRIAIFPRPSILLCGCLLRNSPVAKAVRAYLINTEQNLIPIIREMGANLQRLNERMDKLESIVERLPFLTQRVLELESITETIQQIPELLERMTEVESVVNRLPFLYPRVANLEEAMSMQKERIQEYENWLLSLETHYVPRKISHDQAGLLKTKAKEKRNARRIWAKFRRHFGVSRYWDLPEERFKEALIWLDSQVFYA